LKKKDSFLKKKKLEYNLINLCLEEETIFNLKATTTTTKSQKHEFLKQK
jgi:hypothetical protein